MASDTSVNWGLAAVMIAPRAERPPKQNNEKTTTTTRLTLRRLLIRTLLGRTDSMPQQDAAFPNTHNQLLFTACLYTNRISFIPVQLLGTFLVFKN